MPGFRRNGEALVKRNVKFVVHNAILGSYSALLSISRPASRLFSISSMSDMSSTSTSAHDRPLADMTELKLRTWYLP